MKSTRLLAPVAVALLALFTASCATKKYVRNEAAPVINKTNELDDLTAKNTRDIRDVDTHTQSHEEVFSRRSCAVALASMARSGVSTTP